MRWRKPTMAIVIAVVFVLVVLWFTHIRAVGDWLQVHTGTVDEGGPYYGFWSGFGSDLAEFGILGAIGTGVYHMVRKYNCHEPRCWRIGRHPAAGGQFLLCYRHHPDFRGQHPTHETIERLHREYSERQDTIHRKLDEVHEQLVHEAHAPEGSPAQGPSQTEPQGQPPTS